jgi:hypothetical protein
LWDQSTIYTPPGFESIATYIVGSGGEASVTFNSIPSTFKHLQIRAFTGVSASMAAYIRFNGDSTNSYASHVLEANGGAAAFGGGGPGSAIYFAEQNDANSYGISVVDIADYSSTTKFKSVKALAGYQNNGSGGRIRLAGGSWQNSASPISSIVLAPSAGVWNQGSHFALYGIRG